MLASAYEPEVLFYRQSLGFEESDPAVAVGCMVMVEALASGVAFSRDPRGEAPDKVLIHAAWGLGCSVADGQVNPDVYWVARDRDAPLRRNAGFPKGVAHGGTHRGGWPKRSCPKRSSWPCRSNLMKPKSASRHGP